MSTGSVISIVLFLMPFAAPHPFTRNQQRRFSSAGFCKQFTLFLCAVSIVGTPLSSAAAELHFETGEFSIPSESNSPGERQEKAGDRSPQPLQTTPFPTPATYIPEAVLQEFDAYFRDLLSDLRIPGAAIAIVQDSGAILTLFSGHEGADETRKVDHSTLFNAGPASLAITSLLAAQIATKDDAGVFETPAAELYEPFRLTDRAASGRVTVSHLLAMSAGIPDYTDSVLDPAWSKPEDVFTAISQAPTIAQPGVIHNQSNISAAAAGYLLVQRVYPNEELQAAYEAALKERLLKPAQMTGATLSAAAAQSSEKWATPHRQREDGLFEPVQHWEPPTNAMLPAIGIKLTLDDAVKWIQIELNNGTLPDGTQLAAPRWVRHRWQPVSVQNARDVALGWRRQFYQGVEIIANTGSYDRHTAGVGVIPSYDTGFVIFINADGPFVVKAVQELALSLVEILKTAATEDTSPPAPVSGKNMTPN